jgi:hypothetical protein
LSSISASCFFGCCVAFLYDQILYELVKLRLLDLQSWTLMSSTFTIWSFLKQQLWYYLGIFRNAESWRKPNNLYFLNQNQKQDIYLVFLPITVWEPLCFNVSQRTIIVPEHLKNARNAYFWASPLLNTKSPWLCNHLALQCDYFVTSFFFIIYKYCEYSWETDSHNHKLFTKCKIF